MRHQRRELGLDGSVMFIVCADKDAVPIPATGLRRLDKQQHLTLEEVCGQPTEHSLGKEGPVINKGIENPFVFECLHIFRPKFWAGLLSFEKGKAFMCFTFPAENPDML